MIGNFQEFHKGIEEIKEVMMMRRRKKKKEIFYDIYMDGRIDFGWLVAGRIIE